MRIPKLPSTVTIEDAIHYLEQALESIQEENDLRLKFAKSFDSVLSFTSAHAHWNGICDHLHLAVPDEFLSWFKLLQYSVPSKFKKKYWNGGLYWWDVPRSITASANTFKKIDEMQAIRVAFLHHLIRQLR